MNIKLYLSTTKGIEVKTSKNIEDFIAIHIEKRNELSKAFGRNAVTRSDIVFSILVDEHVPISLSNLKELEKEGLKTCGGCKKKRKDLKIVIRKSTTSIECNDCVESRIECDCCGHLHIKTQSKSFVNSKSETKNICHICARVKTTCNGCGVLSDCETGADGSKACKICIKNNYSECSYCNKVSLKNNLKDCDKKKVCLNCIDMGYVKKCTKCKKLKDKNSLCGGNVCKGCFKVRELFTWKKQPVHDGDDSGVLTSTRGFAVEFEVWDGRPCHIDGFRSTTESSIKDNQGRSTDSGIEYVTEGVMSGKSGIETIKAATAVLRDSGYKVNKTCGLHIHMDLRDFCDDEFIHLLKQLCAIESWAWTTVPPSRFNGAYTKNFAHKWTDKKLNTIEELADLIYTGHSTSSRGGIIYRDKYARNSLGNKEDCRYSWANLHSWFFRGSLEIRSHQGTLNANKVTRWLEFWIAMVEYVKSMNKITSDGFDILNSMNCRSSTIKYFERRIAKFNVDSIGEYTEREEDSDEEEWNTEDIQSEPQEIQCSCSSCSQSEAITTATTNMVRI